MRRVVLNRKILIGTVAACVVAGVGYGFMHSSSQKAPRDAGSVPVVVTTAQRQDINIDVNGLGTVQASGTVDIHAQINGTINKIDFAEGQTVRAGDLLAEIDPRPYQAALAQAESTEARDQAQLANVERDLKRYTDLGEFASAQQIETQRSMLAQTQALVKNDAAAISKAKTDLSYTRITSPISGVTGLRGIDAGNIVHTTDTKGIVTVTQIEPITAVFTLPAQNLGPIQARMASNKLPADAFDQENEIQLGHGELTVVDNQVDPKTGGVRMKATFPNTDHKLWPGSFVNIHLETDVRKNVIAVPSVAVQHGLDGVFVFLIKPDNTVEHRPVTVGNIAGDLTLIETGLAEGDRVVTDGYARLSGGMKVRIVAATQDKTAAPGV